MDSDIQTLLDLGFTEEEINSVKEDKQSKPITEIKEKIVKEVIKEITNPVNVNVDTKELSNVIKSNNQSNLDLVSKINKSIEEMGISTRVLLKELIDNGKIKPKEPIKTKEEKIIGIKVKRNEINLIDYLELVRE